MKSSSEPSARARLLQIQRSTLARLYEQIPTPQGRRRKEFLAYQKRYEQECRVYARLSSKAELIKLVRESSIVYCGDFHTLRQAQRTPIRILRAVVEKHSPVVLGLEMVHRSGEKAANAYVAGKLTEAQLQTRLQYEKRWGFPWTHYRQLFEFAREHRLRILALNSDFGDRIPLAARDDLAADFIVEATLLHPSALIFCLYGDLHVANEAIPGRVQERLQRVAAQRSTLTIFQNSEPIYWQLAREGLDAKIDVVELAPRKYCVLSAAPWVKWQSYRSWLEDQSDLLEGTDSPDYYHEVLELTQQIASFLKLRVRELDHFTVYTASDVALADMFETYCAAARKIARPLEVLVRTEMVENRSCFNPATGTLFLTDLSQNRAAEKGAQIVAGRLGFQGWIPPRGYDSREVCYRVLLWEAIGFFGSRILNPKRKCDHYRDFELLIRETRGHRLTRAMKDRRAVALHILTHHRFERSLVRRQSRRDLPRKLYPAHPRRLFLMASYLGQILAHHLYVAMVADRIRLEHVQLLFQPLPEDPRAAYLRYLELVSLLKTHRSLASSKEDHF